MDVRLGDRSYSIQVEEGILPQLGACAADVVKGRTALLVTDENVAPLYAAGASESLSNAGFDVLLATMPPGEGTKCLGSAEQIFDLLVGRHADRGTVVVALGGGVVGDLAGFVSATFARGVPFLQVPTTLLAMVDSSVGGKVGIDHPQAKNMIGAFHQPVAVLCDVGLLRSLPDRQFRCGMAEVVKYGVIMDAPFFAGLERDADAIARRESAVVADIVARCCRLKADVVEEDEYETTGRRAILNYGHTFAHAFETASRYDELQHGEAVAIGMMCAARLAERLGRVDASLLPRQEKLWQRLGLPTAVPKSLVGTDLVEIMRRDKKARAGRLRFVLPSRLGEVELVDGIDEALVREVIADQSA